MEKSLPFYEKPELERVSMQALFLGADSVCLAQAEEKEGSGSDYEPIKEGEDDY